MLLAKNVIAKINSGVEKYLTQCGNIVEAHNLLNLLSTSFDLTTITQNVFTLYYTIALIYFIELSLRHY